MTIQINKLDAEKNILESFRSDCHTKDNITTNIEQILNATHKTYKYILITGILAKATNEKANPLALQAGAEIIGSYDARSLCHNVIVPFERDFLHNILGGSNEPFLNKPARFTHLSKENAVRRGRDKEILFLLIETLSSIKDKKSAKQYLSCAFKFLKTKIEEQNIATNNTTNYNLTLIEIYDFSLKFIDKSLEGETSATIIGTFEKILHKSFNIENTVKVHKVNQCGASSKEVGDIDIFINKKFSHSIEVKDKNFTAYDVEHALNKVLTNNGTKAGFIYGPHASFDKSQVNSKINEFKQKGLFVYFKNINAYIKDSIFKIPINCKDEFIKTLMTTLKEINCKSETHKWTTELIQKMNWSN